MGRSTLPAWGTDELLAEVKAFHKDCQLRLDFNTRWDNILNISGIVLSVAIIAPGAFALSRLTTVLGGLVAAIVTAHVRFRSAPACSWPSRLLRPVIVEPAPASYRMESRNGRA
jgi:hypothetical protein